MQCTVFLWCFQNWNCTDTKLAMGNIFYYFGCTEKCYIKNTNKNDCSPSKVGSQWNIIIIIFMHTLFKEAVMSVPVLFFLNFVKNIFLAVDN